MRDVARHERDSLGAIIIVMCIGMFMIDSICIIIVVIIIIIRSSSSSSIIVVIIVGIKC